MVNINDKELEKEKETYYDALPNPLLDSKMSIM